MPQQISLNYSLRICHLFLQTVTGTSSRYLDSNVSMLTSNGYFLYCCLATKTLLFLEPWKVYFHCIYDKKVLCVLNNQHYAYVSYHDSPNLTPSISSLTGLKLNSSYEAGRSFQALNWKEKHRYLVINVWSLRYDLERY